MWGRWERGSKYFTGLVMLCVAFFLAGVLLGSDGSTSGCCGGVCRYDRVVFTCVCYCSLDANEDTSFLSSTTHVFDKKKEEKKTKRSPSDRAIVFHSYTFLPPLKLKSTCTYITTIHMRKSNLQALHTNIPLNATSEHYKPPFPPPPRAEISFVTHSHHYYL